LGVWRLNTESIWHDEAWSIRAIRSPFGTPDDNTPVLYYLTLHILQRLGAGETPFALRYGSVLIWLVVVALGLWIGQRWYGATAGVLVGILLGTSPLLWEYAQEVRAYIAVPLFALIFLAGADRLLRDDKLVPPRIWGAIFLAELAAVYTHNLNGLLVVWLNGAVMVVWGWQILPSPFGEGMGVRSNFKRLITWLLLQAALFVLYLPWLSTQSPSGTSLNTVPVFGRELSQDLWRGYILPVVSNPDDLPEKWIWLSHLLPLLAAIALVILVWRGRSLHNLLIFSQVVGLPILSTLLLQRASIDFHPRYYILAIPATLLLLVAAVATLPRSVQLIAAGIVAGVAGYISYQSLTFIADNRQYQHDDFRGLAQYYATLPEDALIIIPYDDEPTLTHYYADKLGIKAEILLMPLYSSADEAVHIFNQVLQGHENRHVELFTWFQVPADERGMYSCLLGGSSEATVSTFQTYGLTSKGYDLAHPLSLQEIPVTGLFNSPLRFGKTRYEYGASYTSSPNGTCLRVIWELVSPPREENYQAAARILSPTGWEIATADGSILRDDQARVGDWEVGDTGEAFLFLELPDGAPAGHYEGLIRQYTPNNPSGFDLLYRTSPIGKDLRFRLELVGNPFDAPPERAALLQANIPLPEVYSGQPLELEVLNPGQSAETLILAGEDWSLGQIVPPLSRWWVGFQIPPDAEAGEAKLRLGDTELASYTVIPTDRLFSPPDTTLTINAQFGTVAILSGATVLQNDDTIEITLVWQSLGGAEIDYTVFVQFLDVNGGYLVGSDAEPAAGSRPTTGWIAEEYIEDSHTIKVDGLNYTGIGTIIAGMYNPITGERLRLPNGEDYVRLPIEIMVR
jgi:hypothetical protein